MDKASLLEERKNEILAKSKKIRNFIENFLDEYSFVETDTFSYGKRDFLGGESFGEGVVTGYASIDGIPVCIFAQNSEVSKGGVSKGQADKILKIQKQAEKTGAVMISVIDTAGVKLGEGITALEGYAQITAQCAAMRGAVPRIAVIKGSCNGAMSYYAALNDIVIFTEKATASTASPRIIAAAGADEKNLCGGEYHLTKTGLADITVKSDEELAQTLKMLVNSINGYEEFNPDTDFNLTADVLNEGYDPLTAAQNIFDKGTFTEFRKGYAEDIICGIAKLGGVTVGAVMCGGKEKGICLNSANARKAEKFIRLLDRFEIPLISFVNCQGAETSAEAEQSSLISDTARLIAAVNDFEYPKISVICGNANGAGYIALASKSTGFDSCIAWTSAAVSPLPPDTAALIEYNEEIAQAKDSVRAREEAQKKYAELEADPFNAAKEGSIDNIIEPSVTRQYLISMLMMLV